MTSGKGQRDDKGKQLSILDLEQDFLRHRFRARRAWRRYRGSNERTDHEHAASAHLAWSKAIDDCLRLVEIITRQQPSNTAELRIQYEAVCWWLAEDDSVLDASTRRWLWRFRRSLRQLSDV